MMITVAVVVAFSLFLVILILVQYRERKDLYDRIMCRDYTEYRAEPRKESGKSAHDKVLERWRQRGGEET